MNIKKESFGQTADGTPVDLYTLTNDHGLEAMLTNYGGVIVSLKTPDRAGKPGEVTLGFDSLAGYLDKSPYFGCIVGRFANRIAGGRFTLEGVEYTLAQNNGPNSLHGGLKGFDKVVWEADAFENETVARTFLAYFLFTGEEPLLQNKQLSFGQRARLELARLVVEGCNVLLLDEPINHLDIPSREQFELALSQFDGAVLAVVHDRVFIGRFADELWWLEDGKLEVSLRAS